MAKSDEKKQLHERLKQNALRSLAKVSVKQGYLVSKEEAIGTEGFEETYLDDKVWTSSWDLIVRQLKAIYPETADLKPKAAPKPKAEPKPKAAPKVEEEG